MSELLEGVPWQELGSGGTLSGWRDLVTRLDHSEVRAVDEPHTQRKPVTDDVGNWSSATMT